jgi:kynurenine aminotransferase
MRQQTPRRLSPSSIWAKVFCTHFIFHPRRFSFVSQSCLIQSSGWNPPQFVIEAARDAVLHINCNQYAPTKGRPRLKKAIASAYSPFFGYTLNPDTNIAITTGANEGMLSAFMAYIESGDEVIVFEPFFDQYISNIEMPGGVVKYVPLIPPEDGDEVTSSAANWKLDLERLKATITSRTKMIVCCFRIIFSQFTNL